MLHLRAALVLVFAMQACSHPPPPPRVPTPPGVAQAGRACHDLFQHLVRYFELRGTPPLAETTERLLARIHGAPNPNARCRDDLARLREHDRQLMEGSATIR